MVCYNSACKELQEIHGIPAFPEYNTIVSTPSCMVQSCHGKFKTLKSITCAMYVNQNNATI